MSLGGLRYLRHLESAPTNIKAQVWLLMNKINAPNARPKQVFDTFQVHSSQSHEHAQAKEVTRERKWYKI